MKFDRIANFIQYQNKKMYRLHVSLLHHHHHHERSSLEHTNHNLVDSLISHNPSLTKYLSKYRKQQCCTEAQTTVRYTSEIEHSHAINDYPISIVEQRNLRPILAPNICPQMVHSHSHSHTNIHSQNDHSEKEQKKHENIDPCIDDNKVYPNLNHQKKHKIKNDCDYGISDELCFEMKEFLREKAKGSRYLSDTAFRKYFHKQCFHDYGRQNIHGQADGFIYKDYLKTHNVNPHSGLNHHNYHHDRHYDPHYHQGKHHSERHHHVSHHRDRDHQDKNHSSHHQDKNHQPNNRDRYHQNKHHQLHHRDRQHSPHHQDKHHSSHHNQDKHCQLHHRDQHHQDKHYQPNNRDRHHQDKHHQLYHRDRQHSPHHQDKHHSSHHTDNHFKNSHPRDRYHQSRHHL